MSLEGPNEVKVGERNRLKIMAAAEQEFANSGFKGTSIQKIADRAELPKTNILYYFKSKNALYNALLEQILGVWNSRFDQAKAGDDPAETLAAYIAEKLETARLRPLASKIFALEIINGAPNLSDEFNEQHKKWMLGRIEVIQAWIDTGKIKCDHPHYLLFSIWASCQHYADFSTQITHLKGQAMTTKDYKDASKQLIQMILNGCGLAVPTKYR